MIKEKITKRDGRVVDFNIDKISIAITQALHSVGGDVVKNKEDSAKVSVFTDIIRENLSNYDGELTTGIVHDLIKQVLINNGEHVLTYSFASYQRDKRERKFKDQYMKHLNHSTYGNHPVPACVKKIYDKNGDYDIINIDKNGKILWSEKYKVCDDGSEKLVSSEHSWYNDDGDEIKHLKSRDSYCKITEIVVKPDGGKEKTVTVTSDVIVGSIVYKSIFDSLGREIETISCDGENKCIKSYYEDTYLIRSSKRIDHGRITTVSKTDYAVINGKIVTTYKTYPSETFMDYNEKGNIIKERWKTFSGDDAVRIWTYHDDGETVKVFDDTETITEYDINSNVISIYDKNKHRFIHKIEYDENGNIVYEIKTTFNGAKDRSEERRVGKEC